MLDLPPLMSIFSPSFLVTLTDEPLFEATSAVKPIPSLTLLMSLTFAVIWFTLLMAFLALSSNFSLYSLLLPLVVWVTVIWVSPSSALTVVVVPPPPPAFLAMASTAFSCATLTASVSEAPAPTLVMRRLTTSLVLSRPTDTTPYLSVPFWSAVRVLDGSYAVVVAVGEEPVPWAMEPAPMATDQFSVAFAPAPSATEPLP